MKRCIPRYHYTGLLFVPAFSNFEDIWNSWEEWNREGQKYSICQGLALSWSRVGPEAIHCHQAPRWHCWSRKHTLRIIGIDHTTWIYKELPPSSCGCVVFPWLDVQWCIHPAPPVWIVSNLLLFPTILQWLHLCVHSCIHVWGRDLGYSLGQRLCTLAILTDNCQKLGEKLKC